MRRNPLVTIAAFALAASTVVASADEPVRPDLVFVADPNFGIEGGVRTTLSAGRILFRYEELLPTIAAVNEHRAGGKTLAVLGRILRLALVDAPLAQLESAIAHEVFGHGARIRELNGEFPGYDFGLPFPYSVLSPRQDHLADTYGTFETGQRDRDVAVRFAGAEANFMTAHWITTDMVQSQGWIHPSDFLVYGFSKSVYFSAFVSSEARGSGRASGDDLDGYVNDLQDRFNRWRPSDRASIARRLQAAYVWNFLDPTLAFALYGTVVNSLYAGERRSRMTLPSVGGITFYPSTRFNLSPFGAEHYVDLFLGKGTVLVDLYGRVGSSGLASYSGGGVRVLGVQPHKRLSLGAEVDVWSQPELLLDARNDYSRPQQWGASTAVFASVKLFGALGLTGKIAYKSNGYLMGQPLDEGFYGYAGLSIAQGP